MTADTPSGIPSETGEEYCAGQVRLYDYDRYFAAAFAPAETRRALLALYAFNLEIASTRERVSEPILGEMRLQWWRDTLDGIYGGTVRKHAVTEELASAIQQFDLPRVGLDRMIDARSFDLVEDPPEDMAALERYAAAAAGQLAGLAGRICGASTEPAIAVAEDAGTVWGLTGVLRAAPFHAAAGRVLLPNDALRLARLTPDMFRQAEDREAIAAAIVPVAAAARKKLNALGPQLRTLPKPVRPAIAYLPVADAYLERLARAAHDVFAAGLEPSRFRGQWRVVRTAWTGRV